jgi:hypothetical protein
VTLYGGVNLHANKGVCSGPPSGRTELRVTGIAFEIPIHQQKAELHVLVEAFEERTAIMEYDGRILRDYAVRLARACIQSVRDV